MIQITGKLNDKRAAIGDFDGPLDLFIEVSAFVHSCRNYLISKMRQEEKASALGIELMTELFDKVVLRSLCVGEDVEVVDFGTMLDDIVEEMPREKREQFIKEYFRRHADD